MNQHSSFCCPNCQTVLDVQQRHGSTLGGFGRAPKNGVASFALDNARPNHNQPLPYKTVMKPIHKLELEHFLMSGLSGAFIGVAIPAVAGALCHFGGDCYALPDVILTGAGAGLLTSILTLGFINRGRYQQVDEPIQVTPTKVEKPKRVKQQLRIEIKEETSSSATRHQWFDLPEGISDEDMKFLAKAVLQSGKDNGAGYYWSHSHIVKQRKALTDYKYRLIVGVLKERGLLYVKKQKTYLQRPCIAFLNKFLETDLQEQYVQEDDEEFVHTSIPIES